MSNNPKTKNISKATDSYLKITKLPTTTNKVKGHSPSPHKKANHAGGGVTLDTKPEELCPDINGFNDLAIDEITGEDIPNENLIRLRADGHLHCYDAVTLKRTVGQNDLKEPMTRIPLPESIIEMIQNHPAQISSEIKESIELGRQQRITAERAEGERNFRDLQLRVAAESRQQQQQPPRPFGQYVQPQSEQQLTRQQLNQVSRQRYQQFVELSQTQEWQQRHQEEERRREQHNQELVRQITQPTEQELLTEIPVFRRVRLISRQSRQSQIETLARLQEQASLLQPAQLDQLTQQQRRQRRPTRSELAEQVLRRQELTPQELLVEIFDYSW